MLAIQKSPDSIRDFHLQFRWYAQEAGWDVAARYLEPVDEALDLLASQPGLGKRRRFRYDRLRGIRSFRVTPPFNRNLLFYRFDEQALYAERVVYGTRDFPRRLLEPPAAQ